MEKNIYHNMSEEKKQKLKEYKKKYQKKYREVKKVSIKQFFNHNNDLIEYVLFIQQYTIKCVYSDKLMEIKA